jgi:hypothetical protein
MFEIQFLNPEQRMKEVKTFHYNQQSIVCLFDEGDFHSVYSWEDLINHSSLYMQEIRSSNSSAAYQKACNEYEKLRSQSPSKELVLLQLLAEDISIHYPGVFEEGFDLGLLVMPKDNKAGSRLTEEGRLLFGFFPRGGQSEEEGWPLAWAPCVLELPIGEEDPGVFWGLVGAGIHGLLKQIGAEIVIEGDQGTAHDRRRKALKNVLGSAIIAPFFVGNAVKHTFLNHALNLLVTYVNKKLGVTTNSVQLSDEKECVVGADESVTIKPKPFLKVV